MAMLLPFLAGCQSDGPPVLSLKEARQVAAQFESQPFTAPPRSIKDLLAMEEKFGVAPTAQGSIKIIDGTDGNTACDHLFRRPDKEIWTYMQTLGPPVPGVTTGRAEFAVDVASFHFRRGNYQRGLKIFGWAINETSDFVGMMAWHYALLASFRAEAGDLDGAEDAVDTALNLSAEINDSRLTENSENIINSYTAIARAIIADTRGELLQAEVYFRRALALLNATKLIGTGFRRAGFSQLTIFELALARNLMRQGRLIESESLARSAIKPRYNTDDFFPTGISFLSENFYEQGRYADAEALARKAIKLWQVRCVNPEAIALATARNVLAKSLLGQKRWDGALAVYQTIRRDMSQDPDSFKRLFSGNLYRGLALLKTGDTASAARVFNTALANTERRLGKDHYKVGEIQGFQAMTLLADGDRRGALTRFRGAVEILLHRSRDADDDGATLGARTRRLGMILEAYIGLLSDIRDGLLEREAGLNSAVEAFRVAEAARSKSVQVALAASAARAALTDPGLATLVRSEQDTQKRISALYSSQIRALSAGRVKLAGDLRARADRLRAARAALTQEIKVRFPDYAALIEPKPPTVDVARAVLKPGEVLITTLVGTSQSYVWAVPKDGDIAFATVTLGRAGMEKMVRDLRRSLAPRARTLGDIPDFNLGLSHELYKALLEPVKAGWKNANSLLVVSHGALGQLPLSLLVTRPPQRVAEKKPLFSNYRDVAWLARSHAVTVLPSVSSLVALRRLPPAAAGRRNFAGFGDPVFSKSQAAPTAPAATRLASVGKNSLLAVRGLPVSLRAAPRLDGVSSAELARLPRLSDTADEVRSIALAMNADLTRDVFIGKDATEGRVKSMTLSGYKVLAFATHGLVPGDLNGLAQPALALSSPEIAGGKDDGLLTMGEILGLKLNADWVVLSACNTAAGQGKGAEAVSGLGQAFFYAGTRALLASNWPVETTSARALTTDLFRRQAKHPNLSRTTALRQSMLELIDKGGMMDAQGRTVFSYAHPIFWAPFSVIGDGGGATPGS